MKRLYPGEYNYYIDTALKTNFIMAMLLILGIWAWYEKHEEICAPFWFIFFIHVVFVFLLQIKAVQHDMKCHPDYFYEETGWDPAQIEYYDEDLEHSWDYVDDEDLEDEPNHDWEDDYWPDY